MEKQLPRYHIDHYDNGANIAMKQLNPEGRTERKYTQWFKSISGKIILVILIVGFWIIAQAVRLSLSNHDVPFVSQAPAPGISIAVSVDPDTNMQLYDLDSSGVLRIRRRTNSSDQTNTKWTSPQIIPTDPTPKKSSPLAALAFQFHAGVTVSDLGLLISPDEEIGEILLRKRKQTYLLSAIQELRIYYLDDSNRIVEFSASSSDFSWSRTHHFSTTSTGGLAAVWLGSEGIRLYFINDDSVGQLMWYANSWQSPSSLNLPALAGTPLAAQAYYSGPGELFGIFLHYVNRANALQEGEYVPYDDPYSFHGGE